MPQPYGYVVFEMLPNSNFHFLTICNADCLLGQSAFGLY